MFRKQTHPSALRFLCSGSPIEWGHGAFRSSTAFTNIAGNVWIQAYSRNDFRSAPSQALFRNEFSQPERVAICEAQSGRQFTYKQLLLDANTLANTLRPVTQRFDLVTLPTLLTYILLRETNGRVAFICPADYSYVATQHAIWLTGLEFSTSYRSLLLHLPR